MRTNAACYDALRAYLETVPIVDCHDHSDGVGPAYSDAMAALVDGYFHSDMESASSEAEILIMQDASKTLAERWPVFQRAWERTKYTGYGTVTRRVMARFYGEDEMSLAALERIQAKLLDVADEKVWCDLLDQAGIVARIEDCWPDAAKLLDGTYKMTPRGRLAISLPAYHAIRSVEDVRTLTAPSGMLVTSLDEYLAACRRIFEGMKAYGAVCFKDQSAYNRSLAYGNPSRAEAEAVFNRFMADPRRSLGYPDECKPLDDYLMHAFMRMARDMSLPVQIHTGHMAGIRNDIAKTNAVRLTSLIELHREVQFDIFHANWPYSGELLFLAKNYSNVAIDFCWANIIDPIYCQRLFKQVISAVPHGKVHAYGSDFLGCPDRAWAHASIARDNLASALSELVEDAWFGLEEAKAIAHAWLFDNPNQFFKLGL